MTENEGESLVSAPIPVSVLGGVALPFHVDGYPGDPAPGDFHAAIRAFLALDRTALDAAAPGVFDYYRHMGEVFGDELDDFPRIAGAADVWDHVTFARHEVTVSRDGEGEPVYVSLEAECDWEVEHGLQVVFRDGARVTKVGPYDGHLTNGTDVLYERFQGHNPPGTGATPATVARLARAVQCTWNSPHSESGGCTSSGITITSSTATAFDDVAGSSVVRPSFFSSSVRPASSRSWRS